jgi:hypothetical protein
MNDDYDLTPLKKKKRKNSRQKGNTFENRVCKILNERFNTKEFCRTPGSGAFATTHTLPKHLTIAGDIITPKNFKFLIECKKGYNANLQIPEFFSCKSWISGVLYKLLDESEKSQKKPLLIIKQDRKEELVVIPSSLRPGSWEAAYPFIEVNLSEDWNWTIIPLEEFLKFKEDFFIENSF